MITSLTITNFKKIEDLKANTNSSIVFVTGENKVGKSSFLQAVRLLMNDHNAMPDEPITKGEDFNHGEIRAKHVLKNGKNIESIITFSRNKPPRMEVILLDDNITLKDKKVFSSLLNPNGMDFDIVKFIQWSENAEGRKKQLKLVLDLLPQEYKEVIASIDIKYENKFKERTELNRNLKELKIKKNTHPGRVLMDQDYKDKEPIDISLNSHKIEEAIKLNEKRIRIKDGVEERKNNVKEIEKEIEGLKIKLEQVKKEINDGELWLAKNVEENIEDIKKQNAKDILFNQELEIYKEYTIINDSLNSITQTVEDITIFLQSTLEERNTAIKDAGLNIDGLDFGIDEIFYNGLPFTIESTSTAERILLGMKISQLMGCEVLTIERGESVGEDMLTELINFANLNNIQIFIEEMRRGQRRIEIIAEPNAVNV